MGKRPWSFSEVTNCRIQGTKQDLLAILNKNEYQEWFQRVKMCGANFE